MRRANPRRLPTVVGVVFASSGSAMPSPSVAHAPAAPTHLTVDDDPAPLAVTGAPAFGWVVNDPDRGESQKAYELIVSDAPTTGTHKVVFDSGPITSGQQSYVHAPGLRLAPDRTYWWTVRTQDPGGKFGPYAVDAHFDTRLGDRDGHASWIRRAGTVPTVVQVAGTDVPMDDFALIRKETTLGRSPIVRARVYGAAGQQYELRVNGARAAEGPSFSYPDEQYYETTDVTSLVHAGAANAFAFVTHWATAAQAGPTRRKPSSRTPRSMHDHGTLAGEVVVPRRDVRRDRRRIARVAALGFAVVRRAAMPRSALVESVVLALLLAACSGSSTHDTATSTSIAAATTTTAPAASTIAWSRLHNPLYEQPDHAVKDPALVAVGGGWVLLFSQVDTHGSWRVGIARSRDLTTWSVPTILPRDPATEGEASPDVVGAPDGTYVVTYQSFVHDRAGGQAKLYARTTTDFTTFSAPIRLLANVLDAPADRLIDPALVYSAAGLLLGFKVGTTDAGSVQHFELARSTTGTLAGPWIVVGRPDITVYGDTVENYEFLAIGGRPALLATSNMLDRPQLFQLAGSALTPGGWLHWSAARELSVPQEAWNPGTGVTGSTFEHANCAFLVGGGAKVGGFWYLVYGDSANLTTFHGAGRAEFGLARSTDLVHWSVPHR